MHLLMGLMVTLSIKEDTGAMGAYRHPVKSPGGLCRGSDGFGEVLGRAGLIFWVVLQAGVSNDSKIEVLENLRAASNNHPRPHTT